MRSRFIIVAVLAFVGFFLFRLGTGSAELSGASQALALVAGLLLFVGAAWWLMRDYDPQRDDVALRNPTFTHFLFESTRSAPLWLGARLYVGYEWFQSGWGKVTDPEWMAGGQLRAYWERAAALPEQGRPPITYDWYRDFIQGLLNGGHATWFAPFVGIGEVLVGVALIAGALVAVAAFFGALMNMSFMLAGSASTNPVLFTLGIALMLAWKVAGYIGVDRVLLPALGATWTRGTQLLRPAATSRA